MSKLIPDPQSGSNPYLDRIHVMGGDITLHVAEAVVMILPQTLEWRGSLNLSILSQASGDLESFVREHVYKPRGGDVYALPGFGLAAQHVILAIVPAWRADFEREDKHLLNAVRKAVELAAQMRITHLAFPPLAMGKNGFPKARAARLILQGIADRLDDSFVRVDIVCPDAAIQALFTERLKTMRTRL